MSDFKEMTLGDIAEVDWGNTSITKQSYVSRGFPAYSAAGMDGFLDTWEYDRQGVVISAIGSVGRISFAQGKWTAIKNTIVAFGNEEICDTRFLYHLLSAKCDWNISGSTQKFLSLGNVKNEEVAIPPLPEQKKIAEILSGIDHLIQKNTLALSKKLAVKQGLAKDIFERVQTNSQAVPLDKLLERPLAYGVLKPGPSVSSGVQLVKIQDCKNGSINTNNLHRISKELHHEFRRTELRGGEIILSVVGTIGRVAVVPKELAGANVSRAFAVVACHRKINNQYLAHFLDSNRIQQWFKDQCQGNAQQVLNLGTLRELPVPIPSSEEQTGIALSINSIDASIAHNCKVLTQLQVLKTAIFSDLLSGRKRVSV